MSTSEIPFLDLVTVHRELREELRSVFDTALDTAGFVGGPAVQEFERDFAAFCESQFCVGMASGTDALRLALAARYDLIVIEDACQAHGAEYLSNKEDCWRKAGSLGRAAAFSFYPGKNLGACGEAGAVTTDDERLARRCQMLRDHGQSRKYFHDIEGYNGRLDAIQAGLLKVKLRHLAKWNEQRRERARGYDELFADAEGTVILPHVPSWSRPVYHLYVVRVADREPLQKDLSAAGIGTGIHYPIPLHLAKAYEALGFRPGDFPVAEQAASQVLSLPMYPELSPEQQRRVATTVLQSMLVR